MTPAESFAAAVGISPSSVTHCVLIGRRGDADMYAFGYWGLYSYTSGTVKRFVEYWGMPRYGQDLDIERLTASSGME